MRHTLRSDLAGYTGYYSSNGRQEGGRESEDFRHSVCQNLGRCVSMTLGDSSAHRAARLTTVTESPLPPTALATLITAQHMRPPQFLPLLFPPVLLFSTYLNLSDYKVDSAGINAAWSTLYLILARRRKQPFTKRWGARGIIRGSTMGLCLTNLLACGFTYATGRRSKEEARREGGSIV